MKKKIAILTAMIILIALITLVVFTAIRGIKGIDTLTTYTNTPTIKVTPTSNVIDEPINATPIITPSPTEETTSPSPTDIVTPTQAPSTINPNEPIGRGVMAEITISTSRKTKTYDIMPNVDESTLKKNIGWLPSSALPNEDGMCVLMGHRDTDFSILKYAEYGDVFTITMNDKEYTYTASDIEVINSDDELRFNAINGKHLVLITCYPFRYTGHAPKKFIIIARQN